MLLFQISPLSSIAVLAVGALFSSYTTFASPNGGHDVLCRCLPDQPCWPSSSVWSALKESVKGNLITTFPLARECHDPYYDESKCEAIKKGYYEETYRRHEPGALLQSNWETFQGRGCLGTNRTTPCFQGSVPIYTIKAQGIADVQETVRFATKYNIRLVIKNTGHDFMGRSTAPSSVSLWTTDMNDIKVTDAFEAEGAPEGTTKEPAVILGPGAIWGDVYRIVDQHKRVVVGGDYRFVGAVGGFCLGGGHGPLSARHGLCADNVLQYKVVTSDGQVLVANSHQNQDIFWALRGGAPGFAVVVEAVYRTHPALKNINYAQATIVSENPESMFKVLRDFYSRHAKWSEEGWSGYAAVKNGWLVVQYLLPDATVERAEDSIKPFLDYASSFSDVGVVNATIDQYPTFYALFLARDDPAFGERIVGINALLGSRLAPKTMFESDHGVGLLSLTLAKIQEELIKIWSGAPFLLEFVAGGQVSKGNSQETSVLPAWRDSLVLFIGAIEWEDDTPYETQLENQRRLTKSFGRLREITPGGGTYANEADPNEPDWQKSFFGSNYPRLRAIHETYDPHGLFICRRCVGSEDWDDDLMCRKHSL